MTAVGVATSFAEQVGFHRVKAYLERMLTEKYYASVPPTLHMLDNICKESERVRRRPLASPSYPQQDRQAVLTAHVRCNAGVANGEA